MPSERTTSINTLDPATRDIAAQPDATPNPHQPIIAARVHLIHMTTPIRTELDEPTVTALDKWRSKNAPSLSRSDAIQQLLKQRLRLDERQEGALGPQPVATLPNETALAALYALNDISGFGPAKFRIMHDAEVDPRQAVEQPELLPFTGRTGDKLKAAVHRLSPVDMNLARNRAAKQLHIAKHFSASILTYADPQYPRSVYKSNNPVPILFVRGDPSIWNDRPAVAVVGSRAIREPYASAARKFAKTAAADGTVVVSGFATGADSIGHRAARDARGRTVCVMPCGLDNVFPPENRDLWDELIEYPGAAFVSEFGFGQRASSLLLRKRNKLIAAFAQGVLVAQSAVSGGAMNAYRFGREQRKPVATFRPDRASDTAGNATIQHDLRTGGLAFDLTTPPSDFRRWLTQLSSST